MCARVFGPGGGARCVVRLVEGGDSVVGRGGGIRDLCCSPDGGGGDDHDNIFYQWTKSCDNGCVTVVAGCCCGLAIIL